MAHRRPGHRTSDDCHWVDGLSLMACYRLLRFCPFFFFAVALSSSSDTASSSTSTATGTDTSTAWYQILNVKSRHALIPSSVAKLLAACWFRNPTTCFLSSATLSEGLPAGDRSNCYLIVVSLSDNKSHQSLPVPGMLTASFSSPLNATVTTTRPACMATGPTSAEHLRCARCSYRLYAAVSGAQS